jgi:defect-in-organelle-trafficking protein DotC
MIIPPAIAGGPVATPENEPPALERLQNYKAPASPDPSQEGIRDQAIHDAALSYGARGGEAHRTWEIARTVAGLASGLDTTFDFRALQQRAPGGLLLNLPVITDGRAAAIVDDDRKSAALADRVLRIEDNVHLSLAVPTWHDYIELTWDDVTAPPALLLPRTAEERTKFKQWVADGWIEGVEQANEIFADAVDKLTRDFVGRVRYRELVIQKIVAEPYIRVTDRGITGNKNELRIGDRQVDIAQPALMNTKPDHWIATPQ